MGGTCCSCGNAKVHASSIKTLRPFLSKTDESTLIEGYLNEELVSIDVALQNVPNSKTMIQEARKKYRSNQSNKSLNTSEDEWIAIYLFTNDSDDNSISSKFYQALDAKSKNKDASIRAWFPFLKLLHEGHRKLKTVNVPISILLADDPELTALWEEDEDLFFCLTYHLIPEEKIRKALNLSSSNHSNAETNTDEVLVSVGADEAEAYQIKSNSQEHQLTFRYFPQSPSSSLIFLLWPGVAKLKSPTVQTPGPPPSGPHPNPKPNPQPVPDEQTVTTPELKPDEISKPDKLNDPDPIPIPAIHNISTVSFRSEPDEILRPAHESIFDRTVRSGRLATANIELSTPVDPVFPVSLPQKPKRVRTDWSNRHFVCARQNCTNECNQEHDRGHCRGFKYVSHNCGHHCDPQFRCYVCLRQPKTKPLHQCNECGWLLCRRCAFLNV